LNDSPPDGGLFMTEIAVHVVGDLYTSETWGFEQGKNPLNQI